MNDIYHREDELAHYGVIGMKWGVRRNPVRAYAKATAKLNKLNRKAGNYRVESENRFAKSGKRYFTEIGKAKSEKNLRKSARMLNKAKRYEKKAERWVKQMDKTFSKQKLSKIEQKFIDKGKEFSKKQEMTVTDKQWVKYRNKREKYYDLAIETEMLMNGEKDLALTRYANRKKKRK